MTGERTSIPMSDHVPELRYAKLRFEAGIAAMAEAVSCPATATIGIGVSPVSSASSERKVPI